MLENKITAITDDKLAVGTTIINAVVISDLPANLLRSLSYEEADVALANEETLARVDSKLAALTADCHQQDSQLGQTQATSGNTQLIISNHCVQQYLVSTEILSTFHTRVECIYIAL